MTNISNKELLKLTTVEKNSIWTSPDKKFKITDIKEDSAGTWIHYFNIKTNQEYNCLIDAFKSRFSRDTQ